MQHCQPGMLMLAACWQRRLTSPLQRERLVLLSMGQAVGVPPATVNPFSHAGSCCSGIFQKLLLQPCQLSPVPHIWLRSPGGCRQLPTEKSTGAAPCGEVLDRKRGDQFPLSHSAWTSAVFPKSRVSGSATPTAVPCGASQVTGTEQVVYQPGKPLAPAAADNCLKTPQNQRANKEKPCVCSGVSAGRSGCFGLPTAVAGSSLATTPWHCSASRCGGSRCRAGSTLGRSPTPLSPAHYFPLTPFVSADP